jgi:hypothetical protein
MYPSEQAAMNTQQYPKQEPVMDSFDDIDEHGPVPTGDQMSSAFGGKYLSVADLGDKKVRARIEHVRMADMKSDDGTRTRKPLLLLADMQAIITKPMVLNFTNYNTLVAALGGEPADWIGADIGVYVDPKVPYGGKVVKGLRLKVLARAAQVSSPAPKPAPRSPNSAVATAEPWPEETGDPGADIPF